MFKRLRDRWGALNEWLRSFILALLILLFAHQFIVRFVAVESTSMFATLRPGDLLLVERWPVWTGFGRGDIVVFRDPLRDALPRRQRPLLVKRIVGLPGDEVELRDGDLFVNQVYLPMPDDATRSYLVRLRSSASPEDLLAHLGLPAYFLQASRENLELPLNDALADSVRAMPGVISAEPMRLASGAPRHIFPFSPRYPWNGDDYGPITVPAKGDTLHINVDNFPLYDRLMSVYEGHDLSADRSVITIEDQPLKDYVVEEDYYFVLGDSRHFSADSRYWGFLPADHVVGRGAFVLLSKGPDAP
ncbi:MAG: signal peptidase I [Flavobacteriales bacterium]